MQTITKRRKAVITKRTKRKLLITIGASLLGGLLPLIAYDVAHRQAPSLFTSPWTPTHGLWVIVLGLLTYSAPSVAGFMSRYVGNVKSWGFVVGLEVAMTCTDHWTSIPALVALMAINAIVLGGRMAND